MRTKIKSNRVISSSKINKYENTIFPNNTKDENIIKQKNKKSKPIEIGVGFRKIEMEFPSSMLLEGLEKTTLKSYNISNNRNMICY